MMYYFWGFPSLNSTWGLAMMFAMILFWIFLTVVIILFVKEFVAKSSGISPTKSSVDILKERYAKGEIDQKEYNEKLSELK